MAKTARDVAYQVLRRVIAQQAFVTLALDAALDASGLPARERRLATELVYGVCRFSSRLDRALAAMTPRGIAKLNPAVLSILRVGAYELLFLDRVPDHAAVNNAARAARRLGGARLAGFVNGALRRLAREGEPPLPPRDNIRARVGIACALPDWIVARIAAEVGETALVPAAHALNERAPLALRVNRHRCQRRDLIARLRDERPEAVLEASSWAPQALTATGLGDPERSPSFAAGLWTVQDVGAQLVGHLVDPAPGWRILDACAGVGGKATHLAELAGGQAAIDAADISENKLARMQNSARRLGVQGVTARLVDLTDHSARTWANAGLAETYDAVVLDAPCTGLGVLRRHPEAKLRLVEADIARMAELQRALLDALAHRVCPGGILVYSVCTFTREEGPDQIAAFLERHADFSLDQPYGPLGVRAATTSNAAPPEHGHPDRGYSDDSPNRHQDSCSRDDQIEADHVPWAQLGLEAGGEPSERPDTTSAHRHIRTWPHLHGADGFFMARMRR